MAAKGVYDKGKDVGCLRLLTFIGLCILLCCDFGCISSHDSFFSKEHLLKANANTLTDTVVWPHLEIALDSGKNVVWCSTFQLAWNKTCELIGEDLHFVTESPMVEILNKRTAGEGDLDAKSYVALAGYIRDGILGKIKTELGQKFKGAACPGLIPSGAGLRPQDIVAYSYLFKNLEFEQQFERLDSPVSFQQAKVSCFGVGEKPKGDHALMIKQVSILDYRDRDDFIIELKTKSTDDQVILAKIKPAETLETTIRDVLGRINDAQPAKMLYGDVLKVPKFNFDIYRQFDELRYAKLKVQNPTVAQDLIVLSAEQSIRFQMDEKGVRLKSEAQMTFGCSAHMAPPPRHIMIFDRPFLMLLKNNDADMPYFAMWINNPELLVPWG